LINLEKVTIIGSGYWAFAFARILSDAGTEVTIFSIEQEVVKFFKENRQHPKFTEYTFSKNVSISDDKDVIKNALVLFWVIPAQLMKSAVQEYQNLFNPKQIFCILSKGIDIETDLTMSEILEKYGSIKPSNIAVLSGPNLASEIIERKPAATLIASSSLSTAKKIAQLCNSPYFVTFISDDVKGVEIAGDLKNVYAILAGLIQSLDFGYNTFSAVLTRALKEMILIGDVLGAKTETFYGLAGLGDLITTASSPNSRNHTLGYKIGEIIKSKQNLNIKELLASSLGVAEGYYTTKAAYEISKKNHLDTPLLNCIYEILFQNAKPYQTLVNLLDQKISFE